MAVFERALAAACIVGFLFLGGCTNPELEAERAKLELARVKSDLDQIYLSLRRLSELGETASKAELPKVEKALAAREAMLIAISDHDHEAALIAADALIEVAPNHKDAVRTIRESGQIFWLLSRAQQSLKDVSDPLKLDEAKPALMPAGFNEAEKSNWRMQTLQTSLKILGKTTTTDNGQISAVTKGAIKQIVSTYDGGPITDQIVSDISKKAAERLLAAVEQKSSEVRFAAISNARLLIGKARSLDPQFKGAVQLDELLDRAHAAMVVTAAWRVYLQGSLALLSAAQLHGSAVGGLQTAASFRSGSVSDFWAKLAPIMRNAREEVLDELLGRMNAAAKNLASYKAGSAFELAEQAQQFAIVCSRGVNRLMEPTGSLIDYRRAGAETIDEFKTTDLRFKAALPQKSKSDEFAEAARTILGFSLYKKPETKVIIDRNEKFYEL